MHESKQCKSLAASKSMEYVPTSRSTVLISTLVLNMYISVVQPDYISVGSHIYSVIPQAIA